jgi:hypothetical protein
MTKEDNIIEGKKYRKSPRLLYEAQQIFGKDIVAAAFIEVNDEYVMAKEGDILGKIGPGFSISNYDSILLKFHNGNTVFFYNSEHAIIKKTNK